MKGESLKETILLAKDFITNGKITNEFETDVDRYQSKVILQKINDIHVIAIKDLGEPFKPIYEYQFLLFKFRNNFIIVMSGIYFIKCDVRPLDIFPDVVFTWGYSEFGLKKRFIENSYTLKLLLTELKDYPEEYKSLIEEFKDKSYSGEPYPYRI